MIQIGRGIRWYNSFYDEVEFCKKHGFDFMQIWFKDGEILINVAEPKQKYIREVGFPVIIHAVFDLTDFDLYGDRLLEIVKYLNHSEVIIHPVCKKEPICKNTQNILSEKVNIFSQKAKDMGIIFYLENNSVIDGFHCTKQELHTVFDDNPNVEQLLDVAHIDNYEHLEHIISVKFPKCLHVAGKHFSVRHEHLPLTKGDIDYNLVFKTYLRNFDGKIILEVDGTDDEIISSKNVIDNAVKFLK